MNRPKTLTVEQLREELRQQERTLELNDLEFMALLVIIAKSTNDPPPLNMVLALKLGLVRAEDVSNLMERLITIGREAQEWAKDMAESLGHEV